MNVLIIPEDFRNDQYVLKPLITAMLQKLGKEQVQVRVCTDPLLRGISQALRWENIAQILSRYRGMVDLFLLCVDRDGESGRRERLNALERQATAVLSETRLFLAENAWQELEVWVLAGHDLPTDWVWREVRQEVHPKEVYFLPFAQQRGLLSEPGEGRKTLANEAARRYARVAQRCPEDVAALEARIGQWIETHA
jgi:hypothetical protein